MEVFYACDDVPSNDPSQPRYDQGRHSQILRVGEATVQLGKTGETWQELCEQAQMPQRSKQLKRSLIELDEYGALATTVPPPGLRGDLVIKSDAAKEATERFASAINEQLANSDRKNIYVYVHGFNSSFANSLGEIAQMHYYLGLDGAALAYAWPSQGELIGGYHADKNNARFTVRHFRLLLDFLATNTKAENIHIIAHSAGAPIVVDTLRQIRFLHAAETPADVQRQTKIGLAMLVAPDGDLDWFINACLDGWMESAKSVHVYASEVDHALTLSSNIYEAPRTGASVNHLQQGQLKALRKKGNLALINVTSAKRHNKRFSGHFYHYMNSWVSSDVLLAMKFGVSPEQRGLTRAAGNAFYIFPEDYRDRVEAIGRELYRSEISKR